MNVLILTGKFGMGHMSAAKTLAEQIQKSNLTANVIVEDIYEWIFPGCCDFLYSAYASMIGKGCKIYNLAYKKTTSEKNEKSRRSTLHKHFMKGLYQVLKARKPDVVVATYSLCALLVSEYKKETGSTLPLVTCITDVTTHNVWTNRHTDLYLVASESTKRSLMRHGVPEQLIRISGIPVREAFLKQEKEPEKKGKRLLIMGGGLGLLPENIRFYQQLNQVPGLTATVITGKNKKLYDKLAGKFANIEVLGFTDQVDRYMRQADLIISKPGGLTLFEAIHSGVPMLVFRPFLEQEIKNGAFIEENQLGIVIDKKPEKSVSEICSLLENQERLSLIRANMKELREGLDNQALILYLSRLTRRNNAGAKQIGGEKRWGASA